MNRKKKNGEIIQLISQFKKIKKSVITFDRFPHLGHFVTEQGQKSLKSDFITLQIPVYYIATQAKMKSQAGQTHLKSQLLVILPTISNRTQTDTYQETFELNFFERMVLSDIGYQILLFFFFFNQSLKAILQGVIDIFF